MTKRNKAGTGCLFCGAADGGGDHYPFYAGFCVDYQEKRAFLSNTVHIRAKYRDLKRYSVPVCGDCTTSILRKRHLPSAIGWCSAAVGCGIGAAVVAVLNVAGDQNVYLLGILGLFGVLTAVVGVIEVM